MRKSLRQCEQRTMDFIQILLLALYITQAFTRSRSRKHRSSSSEEGSIENLLYYKDCQRSGKPDVSAAPMIATQPPPPPPPPPPPTRQSECLYPKMCCALTCGNECGGGGGPPPMSHMQYQPPMDYQNFQPPPNPDPNFNPMEMGTTPVQPQAIRRKKRLRLQPNNIQPPMPSRRDMSGLTKERIKGLIAQDDDIRKILKDLVRVTMQKVDLQDMLKSSQNSGFDRVSTARAITPMVYEMDDYVE